MDDKIYVSRAELKKIVEKSEKRREVLEDVLDIIIKVIGPEGIPEKKWKLVKKVTALINNMDDYQESFAKFNEAYIADAMELVKKEEV